LLESIKKVGKRYERSLHFPSTRPGRHGDDYDARQLERDAGFAVSPSLLEGLPHFNARKWHARLYDDRPTSLMQTVESLGLVWRGAYHRGIDDARNLAFIVKGILG
jgi:inhibitor of KinA sporulation pathway (predicted exonuclease)